MPGDQCIVCNDKKRRPAIDGALQQGSTVADVSRRFHITHESVRRHTRDHLGIAGPSGRTKRAKGAAPIAPTQSPTAPPEQELMDVEPMSLRSPDDVLSALEWSVAETKALLQRAKAAGDLRLQNELVKTAIGALDKLAKSTGLYDDGAKITVNAVDQKIVAVLQSMSTEELREALRATARHPAALETVSE